MKTFDEWMQDQNESAVSSARMKDLKYSLPAIIGGGIAGTLVGGSLGGVPGALAGLLGGPSIASRLGKKVFGDKKMKKK